MNIWKNRTWTPMLLKQIPKPFDSKDYYFEVKFDGIRAVIFANPQKVIIQSRNQKDITYLFPELESIKSLVKTNVIFDGEITAGDGSVSSFSQIQKRIHLKNKNLIASSSLNNPVTFMCFDILYENKDITSLPLNKRKLLLDKYNNNDNFLKVKYFSEKGKKVFNEAKKLGLEGIIAKNINSQYFINKRTDDFIKIKIIEHDEFIIGGYEIKKNNILSLAIGEYQEKSLMYVGNVSISPKASIYKKILEAKKSNNPFKDFNKKITYIKPALKCHVQYLSRTSNNHLRHPIYKDAF